MHYPVRKLSARSWRAGALGFLISTAALADDITGSDELLCYGWSAARCDTEAECEVTAPWRLNMPDFIKVDLDNEVVTTTGGEVEQRETPLSTVSREQGLLIMQGQQEGRVFSWIITEMTGEGTLSVGTPGEGITVFTVCAAMENL